MDVHNAKPVHSWRELLSEIGVIVIGVTIALAAEQAVEALHWRHAAEAQRETLNGSIADHLVSVKIRVVQQPCVDKRIEELATVFKRHATGEALRLKGPVGRPQNASVGNEAWELAVQSGALNHMPLAERGEYAGAFGNYANFFALRDDADRSWIDLAALDNPQGLTDADWAELRRAYAQVAAKEARVSDVATYIMSLPTMGVKPPEVKQADALRSSYAKAFCQPLI